MTELLVILSASYFLYKRELRCLRFFQQHEYNAKRYIAWIVEQRAFDTRGSFAAIASAIFPSLSIVSSIILIYLATQEEDPRKSGKIKLKMTERACRIFRASCTLSLFALILTQISPVSWWLLIALFQSAFLIIPFANFILQRGEGKRQKQFLAEAKAILAKADPYVIGITGSYGKSSTKDALGQILQITLGPTFWPAKGVNTPMGITQEIRTHLKQGYKYAVIEMGAYQRGSIKRLCELTPPHAAIITAVGIAHLERFGSPENIYLGKSELAQSVPDNGLLVCNGDDVGARRMAREHAKNTTLLYGFDNSQNDLACYVSSFKVTMEGTLFTLHWKGMRLDGKTPLIGKAALSNILGAFTLACELGAEPEYVLAIISNLEPVNNRLQLDVDGKITYLRDAYNSNPVGFATALDVMKELPGQRRILMTPGFIELGPKQYEENERIGKMAASFCDLAIVVGTYNREALQVGLQKGGLAQEKVLLVDDRTKALATLSNIRQDGDIILIENDLPDLFEANVKF